MTESRSLPFAPFIGALVAMLAPVPVPATDWPQFNGPFRDGRSPATGLLRTWPATGPAKLWERPLGSGYSGPVVAGNRLVIFHRLNDHEIVECLDARTGKLQWKHSAATGYVDDFGFDDGPRGTPCIAGGRAYCLGAEGALTCLDLETGRQIWARNLAVDYPFRKGYFGVGTSPVVAEGRVFINIGSKGAGVIALDAATGKELWRASDDEASYSTPTVATLGGKPRLVCLTRAGLLILDTADGTVVQRMPFRARIQASVNAATPLVGGDEVFLSSSYNTGAILLKLSGDGSAPIWKNDESMSCHYNSPVRVGDYLYGIHGRQEAGGELRCVEWKTGTVKWAKPGFGCASLVAADGLLLAATETGDVVLVEATEAGYRERGRFAGLAKPVRAGLALANGIAYARDSKRLVAWKVSRP